MPLPTLEYPVQQLNSTNGAIVVPSGVVDSIMVVCIGTHQGVITSVSYGGNALTVIASGRSTFNECGDIWVLLSPPSGSATLTISMSGGTWWGATVYIIGGAKQSTTITNNKVDSASGSSSVCSLTPPSVNCLIIGSAGGEAPYTGTNSPPGLIVAPPLGNQYYQNAISALKVSKGGVRQTFSLGMDSIQRYGMAMVAIEEPYMHVELANGRKVRSGNGMSVTDCAR